MSEKTVIVLSGAELRKIVAAAAFASTDSTLPLLCGVSVAVEGGEIVASATDRYKLVEVGISGEITGGDRRVVLGAETVKTFKAETAKASSDAWRFELTLAERTWELRAPGAGSPRVLSGGFVEGDYPRVGGLFPKVRDIDPMAGMVNPVHVQALAEFNRLVRDRKATWAFGGGSGGKMFVAVSRTARALIMPIRGENIELFGGYEFGHPGVGVGAAQAKIGARDEQIAALMAELESFRDETRAIVAERDEALAEIEALRAQVRDYTVATDDGVVIAQVTHSDVTDRAAAGVDYRALVAEIPNVTAKMVDRLVKALDRGDDVAAAVEFATGSLKGKRAEALIGALTV